MMVVESTPPPEAFFQDVSFPIPAMPSTSASAPKFGKNKKMGKKKFNNPNLMPLATMINASPPLVQFPRRSSTPQLRNLSHVLRPCEEQSPEP